MKFKIGDVVIGNESASKVYSYTGTGWIGVVIDVNSDYWEDICVRKWNSLEGSHNWVSSKHFDLYTGDNHKSRIMCINTAIKRVIYNEPATIVFWKDNTKTVVKCQKGEKFDKEKGLALCIAKKALGNKSNFNNEIKAWIEEK